MSPDSRIAMNRAGGAGPQSHHAVAGVQQQHAALKQNQEQLAALQEQLAAQLQEWEDPHPDGSGAAASGRASPVGDFLCPVCCKRFGSGRAVAQHRGWAPGTSPFPCGGCGRRFCSADARDQHARDSTGRRSPTQAGFALTREAAFRLSPERLEASSDRDAAGQLEELAQMVSDSLHERRGQQAAAEETLPEAVVETRIVVEPNRQQSERQRLRRRSRERTADDHACSTCGRRFASAQALLQHRGGLLGGGRFCCNVCGSDRVFCSMRALLLHQRQCSPALDGPEALRMGHSAESKAEVGVWSGFQSLVGARTLSQQVGWIRFALACSRLASKRLAC